MQCRTPRATTEGGCSALDGACAVSPTGKVVVVCHDWGATYSWKWIMKNQEKVSAVIAFSVGNEFRYDVLEHGPGALIWGYHLVTCLPWLLPCAATRRLVSTLMQGPAAGWIGDREVTTEANGLFIPRINFGFFLRNFQIFANVCNFCLYLDKFQHFLIMFVKFR